MKKLATLFLIGALAVTNVFAENQTPTVASLYSDPWVYIKDELLEVPGYLSAAMFPVKGAGAIGALTAIGKPMGVKQCSLILRDYPERFHRWISGKFDWLCGGQNQGYATCGGIINKVLLVAAAFGGYKLTSYAIDTAFYGFALSDFLYHYPKRNRKMTPPALRSYFDDEYAAYIKGGFSYMLRRTGTVIDFVKKAVALHEANVKLELVQAGEDTK